MKAKALINPLRGESKTDPWTIVTHPRTEIGPFERDDTFVRRRVDERFVLIPYFAVDTIFRHFPTLTLGNHSRGDYDSEHCFRRQAAASK